MTIAVSAVVKPSKLLHFCVGISCFFILVTAVAIGLGKVGELPLSLRFMFFTVLSLGSVGAFLYVFLSKKTFHIDISGIGQIRLTEDIGIGVLTRQQEKQEKENSTHVVRLMQDSTIWPCLLLLRLRAEDQRIRTLVILPDSTDSQAFRRLAVACRWIAAHNVQHAHTNTWDAKR